MNAQELLKYFQQLPKEALISILLQTANLEGGIDIHPLITQGEAAYNYKASKKPTEELIKKIRNARRVTRRLESKEEAKEGKEEAKAEAKADLRPLLFEFLLRPGEVIDLTFSADTGKEVISRPIKGQILSVSPAFSSLTVTLPVYPGLELLPRKIELQMVAEDIWLYTVEDASYWITLDLSRLS